MRLPSPEDSEVETEEGCWGKTVIYPSLGRTLEVIAKANYVLKVALSNLHRDRMYGASCKGNN